MSNGCIWSIGTVEGYMAAARPSPNNAMAGMSTSHDKRPPPTMIAADR
jgi:hypothetical protein